MRKPSTNKSSEPSKASLREMPEVDLKRYRVLGRGRHVEKARRSFESIVLDRQVVETLGGVDALRELIEALARMVQSGKKRRRAA